MTDEKIETISITNERGQTRNYETVASRLRRFRNDNPNHAVRSIIVEVNDEVVRMCIQIGWTADDHNFHILSEAHAEEYRAASEINATSALENCETSALGRALAFLGYGSADSIASAEDVIGAKSKGAVFAQAKPGALILLQNASKEGIKTLEQVWKKTLSEVDREACRPYITKLKKEALGVTDSSVASDEQKEFGK
jgi:hypothetical protein